MTFKYVVCTLVTLILVFLIYPIQSNSEHSMSQTEVVVGLNTSQLIDSWLPSPEGIGGEYSEFGYDISIDGDKALVASRGMAGHGVVYIYEYDGSSWLKGQLLQPSDSDDVVGFGYSVSLSGNYAFISANKSNYVRQEHMGRVYVFEFDGNNWNETQQLIPQNAVFGDRVGSSISVSGSRLAIGANQFENGADGYVVIYNLLDGNWVEGSTIVPSVQTTNMFFGDRVSIEGDRLLVGAPNDDQNARDAGAAYIFDFNGTDWLETKKLLPATSNSFASFGSSVSLRGDKAFVGAFADEENGMRSGAVYEFSIINGVWAEEAKIVEQSSFFGSGFGRVVDYYDGSLMVSSYGVGSRVDVVYLYRKLNGAWSEVERFEAPEGGTLLDGFGRSISIFGDHLLIGMSHSPIDHGAGTVLAYGKSDFEWSLEQVIHSDIGAAYDEFGKSVSVDGDWAMVGAHMDDDLMLNSGAVYVYKRQEGAWQFTQKLIASDPGFFERFGYAVSIYGDRAVIGSVGSFGNNADHGAAYVFEFNGFNHWIEVARLEPLDSHVDNNFGNSVSLQLDRVLIGASKDDENGNEAGAAYIFELKNKAWTQTAKLTSEFGAAGDHFGNAVDLGIDTAVVGAYTSDNVNGEEGGTVTIFEYNEGNWNTSQLIEPAWSSGGESYDWFGYSVSIDDDEILIGAPRDGDHGNTTGVVYKYIKTQVGWLQNGTFEPSFGTSQRRFGSVVKLSDGLAVVGANKRPRNGLQNDKTHLFEVLGNGLWVLNDVIEANISSFNDPHGSLFDINGDTLIVGEPGNAQNGTNAGAVSLYQVSRELIFYNGF